MWFIA